MADVTVCVVGLGYIGLPTAALLASRGYQVHGVDIRPDVVATVNRGEVHIVEPDLDAYVRAGAASGKLRAFETPQEADAYMICVPTPFKQGEGDPQPDLDYVLAAGRAIAPLLKPGNILILESTSPVGTTEQIAAVIAEAGVDTSRIHIAYCPERVLPGRIMVELTENARIVGGLTPEAAKIAGDFYRGFVAGDVLETDARTAEMCKLVENSFRDVNIAFANELSLLCAKLGIDVWQLIGLANRHPRVNVLQPGVGVGGHCIAVDPWFIVAGNPEQSKLIRTARLVNTGKTDWVIEQISARAEAEKARLGRPARVACLGLAFKPNIDDLRESPAIEVAHALIAKGLDLVAVEPNVTQCDGIALADFDTALEQADIVTVLVNHREFNTPAVTERLKALGAMDFCGAL
ncbi:UDP-N-acetyl-D-mannosamine dehydrogenase [Sphingomonas sp. NPDC092331]|jgi:UDP-N-acetyl-D-mannosaminuronic acid dehydrogenase